MHEPNLSIYSLIVSNELMNGPDASILLPARFFFHFSFTCQYIDASIEQDAAAGQRFSIFSGDSRSSIHSFIHLFDE